MNVFMYNNLTKVLELNEPEILLIKEFNDLYKRDKSKSKDRAWAEFTYIYLAIDWKSPYNQYTEQEKHEEALNDSGLTEEKFNDLSLERLVENIEHYRILINLLNYQSQLNVLLINLQIISIQLQT